jgi:hypothetical protein
MDAQEVVAPRVPARRRSGISSKRKRAKLGAGSEPAPRVEQGRALRHQRRFLAAALGVDPDDQALCAFCSALGADPGGGAPLALAALAGLETRPGGGPARALLAMDPEAAAARWLEEARADVAPPEPEPAARPAKLSALPPRMDENEKGCPKCGSRDVDVRQVMAATRADEGMKTQRTCLKCAHSWV